ncbi:hypothetical protein E4U24_003510 [Claviceps purpurea]|nr:hypothetical protein E4U12_005733 [Claviceps purpurea]KAG6143600.1 hypothetical protein E4U38_003801 [Claviceps purpurea]KAG6149617.1 hypothetical protein E4U28_000060 [Claviceps purpurea]KAG6258024.1 hypothetical protein E4U24_003510 [Claviceps purpurea]KAG6296985.1 hypothetical protein E4U46_000955 [Claviceps purpurea]
MTVPGNLAHDNVRLAVLSNEMIRISMGTYVSTARLFVRGIGAARKSGMHDRRCGTETDLLHDPATE